MLAADGRSQEDLGVGIIELRFLQGRDFEEKGGPFEKKTEKGLIFYFLWRVEFYCGIEYEDWGGGIGARKRVDMGWSKGRREGTSQRKEGDLVRWGKGGEKVMGGGAPSTGRYP